MNFAFSFVHRELWMLNGLLLLAGIFFSMDFFRAHCIHDSLYLWWKHSVTWRLFHLYDNAVFYLISFSYCALREHCELRNPFIHNSSHKLCVYNVDYIRLFWLTNTTLYATICGGSVRAKLNSKKLVSRAFVFST